MNSVVSSTPSKSEILAWCMAYLAKTFNTSPERILPHAKFARLGMNSAASVFFLVELEGSRARGRTSD